MINLSGDRCAKSAIMLATYMDHILNSTGTHDVRVLSIQSAEYSSGRRWERGEGVGK